MLADLGLRFHNHRIHRISWIGSVFGVSRDITASLTFVEKHESQKAARGIEGHVF